MPEGVVVLTGAVYLTVACLLASKYGGFSQDAVARMANGFYVLYSRDPHLATVGFVCEPSQSLSATPVSADGGRRSHVGNTHATVSLTWRGAPFAPGAWNCIG